MTPTLQQFIDEKCKEFRKRYKNPKNTGYRVGQEFLGAVEIFIIQALTECSTATAVKIYEFCNNERHKLGNYNKIDDEFDEGYWIAMNTVMKEIEKGWFNK